MTGMGSVNLKDTRCMRGEYENGGRLSRAMDTNEAWKQIVKELAISMHGEMGLVRKLGKDDKGLGV